jgi:hypothetical protein
LVFFIKEKDLTYLVNPYYRSYFGKKQLASFVEKGQINSENREVLRSLTTWKSKLFTIGGNFTDICLGFGFGILKWIQKEGLILE